MTDYIIEHQTRGVLVEQDHDPWGRGPNVHLEWRSRWSPTKLRTEAWRLNADQARWAWSRIDPKVRRGAALRHWGTWKISPNP